ncbi:sensitivity to high expression protein she9 [Cytospora paraplurivora]|uniref:Sensitive to high expression protein 9, mitochondrial n=1 Tax=Cytospora paraplurivora TaxID=2898453 RepID=A0AAN9U1J5_9PEZI
MAMTGPVAATRPLLRSGPSVIIKQLSGPAIIPRPFLPTTSTTSSFSSPSGPKRQLAIRLGSRLHGSFRLYSTQPPSSSSSSSSSSSTPNPSSTEPGRKPTSEEEQSSSTSASPSAQSNPQSQSQPNHDHHSDPELPSQADSRRSPASQDFAHFMDNLQSRVLVASQALNDLTGYSAIESIKASNARLEADLAAAQANLKRARQHYKEVNARRAGTQREVTTLLARKDTWGPPDLERFTTMYRQDHELEAAVSEASASLTEAEAEEARLSQALNSGILKRYHEEQIWSDRIRRQSTWGTWGLMGVNVLLFLVLQFVAEPWKRSRLLKGIAAEEKAALDAVRVELESVKCALVRREDEAADAAAAKAEADAADAAAAWAAAADAYDADPQPDAVAEETGGEAIPAAPLAQAREEVPEVLAPPRISWKEFLSDPHLWRPALEDLYSERTIGLRMRDVSIVALEGAATGAVVAASIAFLVLRPR